ncbi:MAG: alpha/beta fold hydrolase [Steroidobacteraceae bacterium]
MTEPASRFYLSQGLKLHYADWGNESASPLLLIHGERDTCRTWDFVAEQLRDAYHVLAIDLRGHGDSQWPLGALYTEIAFIHDVAQFVSLLGAAPLSILGHSLGGSIGLLYSGTFPENVRKVVAIEGLGPTPEKASQREAVPIEARLRESIALRGQSSSRARRTYPDIDAAVARMREVNGRLGKEKARHLSVHGTYQNEDGTFSWKFDPALRARTRLGDLSYEQQYRLWDRISCPVLLVRGTESWASDPLVDGRAGRFRAVRSVNIVGAGHWVHHDQLDPLLRELRGFFGE